MGASSRMSVVFIVTIIYSFQLYNVSCIHPDQEELAEFDEESRVDPHSAKILKNMARNFVLSYLESHGIYPEEDQLSKRSSREGQQRETRNDNDFSKLVNSFGRRNVAPSFSKWTFGKRSGDAFPDNQNVEKRRMSSFTFGKRSLGDQELDEKRRLSSFSFGKRAPISAFTFGKRLDDDTQLDDMEADKRYSAFTFGKRSDDKPNGFNAFTFGKKGMDKRLSAFTFGKRNDDLKLVKSPFTSYIPANEALIDDIERENINNESGNSLPMNVLK